jgi:hypothetical protein
VIFGVLSFTGVLSEIAGAHGIKVLLKSIKFYRTALLFALFVILSAAKNIVVQNTQTLC